MPGIPSVRSTIGFGTFDKSIATTPMLAETVARNIEAPRRRDVLRVASTSDMRRNVVPRTRVPCSKTRRRVLALGKAAINDVSVLAARRAEIEDVDDGETLDGTGLATSVAVRDVGAEVVAVERTS